MKTFIDILIILSISSVCIVAFSGFLYFTLPEVYSNHKWVIYVFSLAIGICVNAMIERKRY